MSQITSRLSTALADHYRIEQQLGIGGMASVHLAQDLKHDRKVAIKVLRPELAAVLGAERFVQEIKTTANLQHPHILPLFDSGEADGFVYYVMPFIDGETLRDKLNRETQLGIDEALKITIEIADALDYAHRHNVIHRDIKPENILLHDGRPVVADFGIALAVSAAAGGRMTETGLSLGTPHYMSPEQATADKDLTNRSDIYSLGAVLYEMLTGDPPHTGSSAQQIIMKIVADEARPITELRKSVPANMAAAVAKSLEKLPADRFATANEFSGALMNPAFAGASTQAASVKGIATGARWNRLNVVTAVVATLMSILAILGWLRPTPDPGPVVRSSLHLGDAEFFDFSARMIVSPDGRRLAYSGRGADGETGIYTRDVHEAEFRLIPGTRDGIYPSFSPDGAWIAYTVRAARTLFKVSLDGGAPQPIYQSPDREPIHASWGDDGWIVLFKPDDQILRVRETGGEPEVLLEGQGTPAHPQALPGGAGIIFGNFTTQSVDFLAFGGDSATVVVPNARDPRYVEATGHLLWSDPAGALFAAPFNPSRGALTDERRFVLAGLEQQAGRFARYDVSRNGTLVYSSAGIPGPPLAELVVVNMNGSVDVLDLDPRSLSTPRWSPDGRFVTYGGLPPSGGTAGHIFVYDVELRTAPRQLTTEGNNGWPLWSPDGSRIAFVSVRMGTFQQDLFVVDVETDLPAVSLAQIPLNQRITDWPREDLLVVDQYQTTTNSLVLVELGDSVRVRDYHAPEASTVFGARVSPDGRLLAYTSDEAGPPHVFVRSFPEPGPAVRVSERAGVASLWSPDGTIVYYLELPTVTGAFAPFGIETEGSVLVAATIERGPTPSVGSRTELFRWPVNRAPSDLHPDGDRFIAARTLRDASAPAAGSAASRTFIVTNWFRELRERLGR